MLLMHNNDQTWFSDTVHTHLLDWIQQMLMHRKTCLILIIKDKILVTLNLFSMSPGSYISLNKALSALLNQWPDFEQTDTNHLYCISILSLPVLNCCKFYVLRFLSS